jgi:hypothetical protein
MTHPERISAEEFRQYVPGNLISVGGGHAWKDLLVEIHSRQRVEESLIVPAVASRCSSGFSRGAVQFEERELGGEPDRSRQFFSDNVPHSVCVAVASHRRGTVRSHAWFHWAAHFFEAIKDVLGVEADVAKQSVDDARSDKLTDLVLEMDRSAHFMPERSQPCRLGQSIRSGKRPRAAKKGITGFVRTGYWV